MDERSSNQFEIRRADQADRHHIVRLVSNMAIDDGEARYEWLYLSNPHGRAITWLAEERVSGKIVACKSLFPRKVLVDGKQRIGSLGGDCYVEPPARRKGLATLLHRTSFQEMAQCGVDLLWGAPNAANLAALLKAGSHQVASFDRWIFPLSLRAIYLSPALRRGVAVHLPRNARSLAEALPGIVLRRLANRRVDRQNLRLEPVHSFGAEFDRLFATFAAAQGVICVRDRNYLNWRYLAVPSGSQKPIAIRGGDDTLIGFAAVEIRNGCASIIDLIVAPEWTGAALQALLDEARRLGCGLADIFCCPGTSLVPELTAFGFWKTPNSVFHVALSDSDTQIETLLNPVAWHFLTADTDSDVSNIGHRMDR